MHEVPQATTLERCAVANANRLEWIGKYAAIASALVAASIGIAQYRRGVSQSVRELEWRQAEMARTMINGMMSDQGWDAMTMLDWEEGRTYESPQGRECASSHLTFLRQSKHRCASRAASARRRSDSSPIDSTAFFSS